MLRSPGHFGLNGTGGLDDLGISGVQYFQVVHMVPVVLLFGRVNMVKVTELILAFQVVIFRP